MNREFKQERYIIDKDEFEGLVKKYEACEFCNKATKIAEILGFTVGAFGLLSKSFVLGGIGIGIAGFSLLTRAISNKIQDKTAQKLEMLSGKPIHLMKKDNSKTGETITPDETEKDI